MTTESPYRALQDTYRALQDTRAAFLATSHAVELATRRMVRATDDYGTAVKANDEAFKAYTDELAADQAAVRS